MTFDLTAVAQSIQRREAAWAELAVNWTYREISPNYGKATTGARFEGANWLGEISVWATGETELETMRADGRSGVNKHYNLIDAADLEGVLCDLIIMLRDGVVPVDAVTYDVP